MSCFLRSVMIVCLLSIGAKPVFSQETTIDLNSEKQIIRGFGGSSVPSFGDTPDLTTDEANRAFGTNQGQIGLSIFRIKVPSDKSQFNDDVQTALRAKACGAITIASPWSPPVNMKTNNNIVGGSLKTSSYGAYAEHLKSFCDFMEQKGAPLYGISVQNEPDIKVKYESCDWTASEMVNFLTNNASVIGDKVKIMAPESFQFKRPFSDAILNDEKAASKVDIIAAHIYGGGLSDYPLARQKGKEIWMTEHFTTTDDANIWDKALNAGKEIHDCMVANFSAYVWWYIRRFYGMLDAEGHITKRGYIMSHFSRFVRPGYVRVDATASPATNVNVTAYKHNENVVIVVLNRNASSNNLTFSLKNSPIKKFAKYTTSSSKNVKLEDSVSVSATSFSVSFEANSITTLVGKGDVTGIESIGRVKPHVQSKISRENGTLKIRTIGNFKYRIYNLNGGLLETGSGIETVNSAKPFESGTYIVNVTTSYTDDVIKFVKK